MPADLHRAPNYRHIMACALAGAAQPAILLLPVAAVTGAWGVLDPAVAALVGMAMLWAMGESLAQGTSFCPYPANIDDFPALRSIDRRYRGLSWASSLSLLLVLWVGVAGRAAHDKPRFGLFLLGVACMVVGIALRVAAIRSLGTSFRSRATVTESQALRTAGIHGWLRHPSETGLLLLAVGASAALGSIFSAVIAAFVLLPSVLGRIALEDRELRRAFGPRFVEYRRRVPALTPLLFRVNVATLHRAD